MDVTRQLFQLQELDTEIEQAEQSLASKKAQLGDKKVLDDTQNRLSTEQHRLDEYKHQHRNAEAEVDDLLTKITATEEQLYSGKVTNPKELSSLQHEITTMKSRSDQLENDALEIIDRVDAAEKTVSAATIDYQKLEEEWNLQQKQLAIEIEHLKTSLADLQKQRQELAGQIDTPALTLYERIRKQKKQAVAKVEQGICRACRISQSASALQKARSGQPVQCGTCGRILFIS